MELLVRVVDKVNDTSELLNSQCTKRGDIIVIVEDGHNWGEREKDNPAWRIIKMPGENLADNAHLLEAEDKNLELPARRKNRFKLDDVNVSKAFVDDVKRVDSSLTIETPIAELTEEKVKKPK